MAIDYENAQAAAKELARWPQLHTAARIQQSGK